MAEEGKDKKVSLDNLQPEKLEALLVENIQQQVADMVKQENPHQQVEAHVKKSLAGAGQSMGQSAAGGQSSIAAGATGNKFLSTLSPAARVAAERRQKQSQSGRVNNLGKSSLTSAEQRSSAAENSRSAKAGNGAAAAEQQKAAQMQQAAATRQAVLKAKMQARMQQIKSNLTHREKAELDSLTIILVIIIFIIAVGSDVLEVVLTVAATGLAATAVLSPLGVAIEALSSFMGFCASLVVSFLWWSIGSGDFSGRAKKFGKRAVLTMGGETLFSVMPWLTIECIFNFLDLVGFFDMNKTTQEVKNIVS